MSIVYQTPACAVPTHIDPYKIGQRRPRPQIYKIAFKHALHAIRYPTMVGRRRDRSAPCDTLDTAAASCSNQLYNPGARVSSAACPMIMTNFDCHRGPWSRLLVLLSPYKFLIDLGGKLIISLLKSNIDGCDPE